MGRKELLRQLGKADGAHADVGIFDDAKDRPEGEYTNAQIGAVHEFGTSTVPERSWLRSNHDKHARKYIARLDKQYARILAGKARVVTSLVAFGERVASDVRRNITAIRTPPLEQSTIDAKGSSNPLIDTGAMRNAVSSRVVLHGGKKA